MMANPIHTGCLSVCIALVLSFTGNVQADTVNEILAIDADLDFGEYLAGECSACHNPNATADSSVAVPNIHGADKQSLIQKLMAYRSGERDNTTMKGVAGGLSNDEIAALAAYLASLNPYKNTESCADDCDEKEAQDEETHKE